MGEMADILFDMALEEEAEESQEINFWLTLTDDELREKTAGSRNPLVMSIRQYPKPLSDKQKFVLARWLAANNY